LGRKALMGSDRELANAAQALLARRWKHAAPGKAQSRVVPGGCNHGLHRAYASCDEAARIHSMETHGLVIHVAFGGLNRWWVPFNEAVYGYTDGVLTRVAFPVPHHVASSRAECLARATARGSLFF